MNTKISSKMYDQLTARERLSLLLAASGRQDAVERQRLMDSAPRESFSAPHHYGLITALVKAADTHLLSLLDVAASYWQWWGLLGWHHVSRHSQTVAGQGGVAATSALPVEDKEELRLMGMVRFQGYLFITYVDGWKQFCRDWPLDPAPLLHSKPGWDMVVRTEAQARKDAYLPEEAELFLISEMPLPEEDTDEELELPQVVTVQGMAQAWRAYIEHYLECHGGKD